MVNDERLQTIEWDRREATPDEVFALARELLRARRVVKVAQKHREDGCGDPLLIDALAAYDAAVGQREGTP